MLIRVALIVLLAHIFATEPLPGRSVLQSEAVRGQLVVLRHQA